MRRTLAAFAFVALGTSCSTGTEDLARGDAGTPAGDAGPKTPADAASTDAAIGEDAGSACPAVTQICAGGECRLDVHLDTVRVGGTITVGGAGLGGVCDSARATLTFVDRTRSEVFTAPVISGAYQLEIYPGRYDVFIGVQCPISGSRPVAAGLSLTAPENRLDVALELIRVSGQATFGGQAIPGCGLISEGPVLAFTDRASGDLFWAPIRTAQDGSYETYAFPGVHEVALIFPRCDDYLGGKIPIAEEQLISGPTVIDLIVGAETLDGTVRLDGRPLSGQRWRLQLWDRLAGRSFTQYLTATSSFSFALPPGTYDLEAQLEEGEFLVARNWTVPSGEPLDIRFETGRVRGCVSIDRAPIATRCPGSGSNGTLFFLGAGEVITMMMPQGEYCGSGSAIDVRLAPGTYDVYFWPENYLDGSCIVPPETVRGQWLIAGGVRVSAGAETLLGEIQLTTVPVSFSARGQMCEPNMSFGSPRGGGVSANRRMYPGVYDVRASVEHCFITGDDPRRLRPEFIGGERAILRNVRVDENTPPIEVDLETRRLSGALSFGGLPIPEQVSCGYDAMTNIFYDEGWIMYFTNRVTGEEFTKYVAGGSEYSLEIYPGVYDIDVSLGNCQAGDPATDRFRLIGMRRIAGCVEIR